MASLLSTIGGYLTGSAGGMLPTGYTQKTSLPGAAKPAPFRSPGDVPGISSDASGVRQNGSFADPWSPPPAQQSTAGAPPAMQAPQDVDWASQIQAPDFGSYGYNAQSGAANLIDTNKLSQQFNANPGVLAQFAQQLQGIQSQRDAAAGQIAQHQNFGSEQVGTYLPAELQRIYGDTQAGQAAQGAVTDNAMSQFGLSGGSAGQLAGTTMAQNLGRGGYEAAIPLLKAGFGEEAANRSGALAQMVAQLNEGVQGQQNQYQQGLDSARQSALTQAGQFNAQTQNQAAQAAADARNRAAEFQANAKNQAASAAANAKLKAQSDAQQRQFSLAQAGIKPTATNQDIYNSQAGSAAPQTYDQWMQQAPSAVDPRLGAAIQREQPNFISQQPPQVQKAFKDMSDSLRKDPNAATALAKKYPKYTRALSLALAQSGAALPALGK